MQELYIADLRIGSIPPTVESEIVRLLGKGWRTVYIAGDTICTKPLARDLNNLIHKNHSLISEMNKISKCIPVIILWDSYCGVSQKKLKEIFCTGEIVTNYIVENMVMHANKFDNKSQQRIIWLVNFSFFLHWIMEKVELGMKAWIRMGRPYNNYKDFRMIERQAAKRFKEYQMLAMTNSIMGTFSCQGCTYFRW